MIRTTDLSVVETERAFRKETVTSVRDSSSFSREEAKAEVGTPVHFKADYRGFREGAVGHVVDYHENSRDEFDVVVLLDAPRGRGQVHERFSKAEYNRFLRRLPKA